MSDSQQFAREDGSKDPEIRRLYEEANRKQACPFDELDPAVNKPVFEIEPMHWNVWFHPKPQRGTSAHVMLGTKEHLRYFEDLSLDGQMEYFELIEELRKRFGDCFSLVSRIGGTPEANLNATTIYHLHTHFVVSDAKPVPREVVPEEFWALYERLKGLAPEDTDPLEFIDDVREWIDVARAVEKGTAWPIRFKISNKATELALPRS